MQLTPAHSNVAGVNNYCYWDGEGTHPLAARVFRDKAEFVAYLYEDLGAWDVAQTNGEPYGPWLWGSNQPDWMGTECRVGQPGFQWLEVKYPDSLRYRTVRFPHIGGIWFGEEVTLGSNVTIDRGALGDTLIGNNVHIDSHVHIGHNADIGYNTQITAGAIIGGSAVLEGNNYVGLGAIIRNKAQIGLGAKIGMGAVVVKDIPPGDAWWVGNPARKLET
jgi:acetyltransferase-like isoleucine patch superfamily enzyme